MYKTPPTEVATAIRRRTLISSAAGMALGLVGCGGRIESGPEVETEAETRSRIGIENGATFRGESGTATTGGTGTGTETGTETGTVTSTVVDTTTATTPETVTNTETANPATTASPGAFVHPGLLHAEADFERMRSKIAAKAEPWLSGWTALASSSYSQLDRTPRPLQTVIRGGSGQNFAQLYIDVERSYQLALRWKLTDDEHFAEHAVKYLDAWSSTLTGITGNADRYLAAGIYGYQFANAGEIMRTYAGWPAESFARFQKMMLEVFYPLSSRFLREHNNAVITNYWANWDQSALACVLAVGVLCDRRDIYDEALAYYRNGAGNGAGLQAVCHVHPGNLGQWQESGRDQGHATLGIGLAGAFCEMAWNQGDDVFGYDNNRYLAGAEYVAKSNLTDANGTFYAMPYLAYSNKQGTSTGVSPASLGHRRPVWELVQHHYEGRLGVATKYVKQQAQNLRPENDGGNGDQLGLGTLTFTRDPLTGRSPSGLTARQRGTQAVLSWWGTPDAVSYNVKRAASSGGPYTTIASGIVDLLTWTDTLPSGTSWYVITAVKASGESAASNEVSVSARPQLSLHLRFDEGTGLTTADATARWPACAITSAAGWTTGRSAGASALDGTSSFVTLPAGITDTLGDFTIAAWVYLDASSTWARLFDFGSGPRRSMFLTTRSNSGMPRFAISTTNGYNAQVIDGNVALPTGAWSHVAVTLAAGVGTMYVNGAAVGTNPSVAYAPYHLGAGAVGWIGRSQYSSDPYLKGKVDEFRVYQGALDAAAVAALAAG